MMILPNPKAKTATSFKKSNTSCPHPGLQSNSDK